MITKMIEKLKDQRRGIDFTIRFLEGELSSKSDNHKRKQIVKSIRSYKKKHWTQRPENRAKLMKSVRKMLKAKYGK